jgi:hypothetical protein
VRLGRTFNAWVVGALMCAAAAAHADPEVLGRTARLSAALGGKLDPDMGEAGGLDHNVDYSTVAVRPGRSAEYRRRVAVETPDQGATPAAPCCNAIRPAASLTVLLARSNTPPAKAPTSQ